MSELNKTNYFIECLELMGYSVDFVDGECYLLRPGMVWKDDEPMKQSDVEKYTIQELIKRDGVMKRVVKLLNKEYPNRYYVLEEDAIRILGTFGSDGPQFVMFETAIELAIELNMTPKELMGVEG